MAALSTMTSSSPPGENSLRLNIECSELESRIFATLLSAVSHFGLNVTLRVAGGWVRDKIMGKEVRPASACHLESPGGHKQASPALPISFTGACALSPMTWILRSTQCLAKSSQRRYAPAKVRAKQSAHTRAQS